MIETTAAERVIHLLLFVAAVATVGVVAIAMLERVSGSQSPVIRAKHVGAAAALTILLFGVELAYHRIVGH